MQMDSEMVASYCDNEIQEEEQSLDRNQLEVGDQEDYSEKKAIDWRRVERDSLDVNRMDQDDVMPLDHVPMDQTVKESLALV